MRSHDIDRILAEQSSEFIEVIKRREPRDLARFSDWLRESRRHVRHMLMMVALDQELRHIDPERKWQVELVSSRSSPDVIPLTQRTERSEATHAAPRRLWWSFAAACVVGLLVVTGFHWISNYGTREFTTGIGEQRAVELEDGSVIHLNTQSRIGVRYSAQARDLELLAGEALFKVRHDAARPFRVFTSDAVIQAVGTQFNVYRRRDGTTVSVLEGRVRVSADPMATRESTAVATPGHDSDSRKRKQASLGAGEQANVNQAGEIATMPAADVDLANIAAWRQRRLVFKQSSLAEVVTEFNRYNRVSQFRVIGAEVAGRRYSGIFDADDPESLIELLRSEPDLALETSGDVIVIRERTRTGALAQGAP